MRFRADGKVYDFDMLPESEQDEIMREWHKSTTVECLCKGGQTSNPLLYVKQVNDRLFFANNPLNSKNDIRHDFKCRYNRQGYRSLLEGQGIHVDEDEIKVNLAVDTPKKRKKSDVPKDDRPATAKFTDPSPTPIIHNETNARKVQLTALIYTMLQEYKITEYRPGGRRNIASRLYKIAQIIKVNDIPLSEIMYVADNKGKWPNRDKHQLIIAWGRRSAPAIPHPSNPKFIRLPLFSVDDPYRLVTEQTMLKSIYEKCTSGVPDVDSGYYLLFRGPAHKGDKNIWDRQLCFIPAEEEITRIPVGSSTEARIINELAKARRHFERPLIGNVTELFLDRYPDIMLHDTEPKTILVVRDSDNTGISERKAKREGYTGKGYEYAEWDGEGPFPF